MLTSLNYPRNHTYVEEESLRLHCDPRPGGESRQCSIGESTKLDSSDTPALAASVQISSRSIFQSRAAKRKQNTPFDSVATTIHPTASNSVDEFAIDMDEQPVSSYPRVHKWIVWKNALFVALHSFVVFFVLFSPLLVTLAAPVILTSGLLTLHALLAGILAMHQISINLHYDELNYDVPDVLLVAPSHLIVTVNIICFVFNILHVVSLVTVVFGVCSAGIDVAACASSRNAALVVATLSSLAAAVNVGGMITYARICCANEHHVPGIGILLSRIPSLPKSETGNIESPAISSQSAISLHAPTTLGHHPFRKYPQSSRR